MLVILIIIFFIGLVVLEFIEGMALIKLMKKLGEYDVSDCYGNCENVNRFGE